MSGGKFGPNKTPERRCMPLSDWPLADQSAWRKAMQPANPFQEGTGLRSTYRPHSNLKVERGYGRWLTYLKYFDPVALQLPAGDRVGKQRILAYVQHLRELGNAKSTVLSRLQELGDAAKVVAGLQDLSAVTTIASKVRASQEAGNNKRARLVTSDELLQLGVDLMENAASETPNTRELVRYRDGLIIAMLSLIPLRRRNVAALELGTTLHRVNGKWYVMLPGELTKNHTPLEFAWPEFLVPYLATYLEEYRTRLAMRNPAGRETAGRPLWLTWHGSAVSEMELYTIVMKRTKQAFGRAINPHLFRDAAATSMAIFDPEHVGIASPLLGHRDPLTTEKYYQQAKSIEASRGHGAAISRLRELAMTEGGVNS